LRAVTEEPFELDGHSVRIGISIGCSRFPVDGNTLDTLLRIADASMYANKTERRDKDKRRNADRILTLPTTNDDQVTDKARTG